MNWAGAETPDLSDPVFTLLRDLIQERTGLYYSHERRELLADKLAAPLLARNLPSFLDYYYYLKYDVDAAAEWGRVLDALSVPETYFWREFDQVRALVEEVVPAYFATRGATPLRIWCAACATGEEPLSIAMALQEAGAFALGRIEIIGSDGSAAAIARARAGVYRDRSFRSLPAPLLKYFTAAPGGRQIDPAIHERVQWRVANLLQPADVTELARAPVIFCRNVLIYFSSRAIRELIRLFHAQMGPPGYLFVGAAESLLQVSNDFELCEIGGTFVYRKC
ncbi:MAG TPA: protein-glutamate O-methyltransferase CheR [Chloroflexia bacterium]|nr:protein-glutamate O-methyltransferase CheR [Chloroflexia bacterium]